MQLAIVVPDERGAAFDEDWIDVFPANRFPPKPARFAAVRVTYAGATLATFDFLHLDDGRYLLPLPPAPTGEDRMVDQMQAALGRIVSQGAMHTFEDGIRRAGIRIVTRHQTSKPEWMRDGTEPEE